MELLVRKIKYNNQFHQFLVINNHLDIGLIQELKN
jgi:hypothetical protein